MSSQPPRPDLDICGRCLIQVSSMTSIRARMPDRVEPFPEPSDPVALRAWVEERLYGEGARFDIDNTTNRFTPFATWHGDPVCSFHLWMLADAEQKRGYRA